ncbi:hypothetical protein OSTOST_19629 [Ostertagia ostertagi]
MFGLMVVCGRLYDMWNKKPFYFGTEKAKLREEELNETLNRAREQAERGVVDEETVRTLEEFLSLEGCGWSAKRIQEALELLRQASLGQGGKDAQPSPFSFSVIQKEHQHHRLPRPPPYNSYCILQSCVRVFE